MIESDRVPVAVSAERDEFQPRASEWARELNLPLLGPVDTRKVTEFPLLLVQTDHGLVLQATGRKVPGPVKAEFVTGKAGYRRHHGGGAGQLVARAVGLKKTRQPLHVFDATAGLGEDAFVLAGLGCSMTLMERSPVVRALLRDGLERGAEDPATASVVSLMELLEGDSRQWLEQKDGPVADVVYLDPMFPETGKAAKSGKAMTLFRTLVGTDDDAPGLVEAALGAARYRVVVKRPRLAPTLEGPTPDTQIVGKSSRFDLYTIRRLPQ